MMESSSAADDALNEAMSMLDSLTGGEIDNGNDGDGARADSDILGFAIDSDDDGENFNLESELEGIDLTTVTDGDGGDSLGETDRLNSSTAVEIGGGDGGGALDCAANKKDDPPGTTAAFVHPLQDGFIASSFPANNFNNASNNSAAVAAGSSQDTNTNRSSTSSWTANLSTNLASFAKVASASIQSAVETAGEAASMTLIHHGHHQGGEQPVIGQLQQQHAQQMYKSSNNSTTAATTVGQKAAPPAPAAAAMSYQERQRLLHQQYHAEQQQQMTTHQSISPPRTTTKTTTHNSSPSKSSPRASPITTTTHESTTLTTTTPTSPTTTFLEKLTTNLDTSTKNSLILQALADANNYDGNGNGELLLPGERVIMFINNLSDVKDSRYGHVFVGSGEGMSVALKRCLLPPARGSGENGGGVGVSTATTTTVWCCVMTFYRVILFSYEAGSEDGKILLSSNDSGYNNDESTQMSNQNNSETIQQWLKSRNVSIQFQAAHFSNRAAGGRKKHHVFQMPLASIERVEKVLSSSQKPINTSANGVGNSGVVGGGYSSYTNNYLPTSNAVSSASSAMSQLGNQMKPLTGLVAGIAANMDISGETNSNLLMNNGANSGPLSSPSFGSAASGPLGIIIHGKDGGRWIKFSTSSYTDAARAHEALNTFAFPGRKNLGYLFAFESRRTEVMASSGVGGGQQQMSGGGGEGGNPIAASTPPTRRRFVAMEEFSRQGIVKSSAGGGVAHSSPWTVIHANAKNYGLCSTYPSVLVVPRSIVGVDDGNNVDGNGMGILRRCAAFRSENRFPVLTWGSSEHGGSIWRSSQPKVGLQGYRSTEDERYLYAIGEEAKRANLAADARVEGGVGSGSSLGRHPKEFLRMLCGRNNESDLIMEGSNSSCMLKIMDMRPKSAAMANRTQGYGYENTNYYRGATINFYGIGNIHAVRDAYQKVNALCLNPDTSDIQWMQLVENTNWPSMTRLILSASWQTAFHVHYNRLPVLLHCSHGWDRTSQVSALAQLLLDPHYRTREGFSTLVEKDFLSFGHPFHLRSGHGEGKNEQGGDEGQLSPIFLQFLDCVFQLVNQFPNYFEFNARYLLLLSENIYSCRFGTLLCDSEREREVVAGTRQRTYCMWEYLDSIPELVNPLFKEAANNNAGVLIMPLPMLLRNVTLWTDRLSMYGAKATIPCMPQGHLDMGGSTLHTSSNEVTDSLQQAIAISHMWRETALAALKDIEALKKKGLENKGDL